MGKTDPEVISQLRSAAKSIEGLPSYDGLDSEQVLERTDRLLIGPHKEEPVSDGHLRGCLKWVRDKPGPTVAASILLAALGWVGYWLSGVVANPYVDDARAKLIAEELDHRLEQAFRPENENARLNALNGLYIMPMHAELSDLGSESLLLELRSLVDFETEKRINQFLAMWPPSHVTREHLNELQSILLGVKP